MPQSGFITSQRPTKHFIRSFMLTQAETERDCDGKKAASGITEELVEVKLIADDLILEPDENEDGGRGWK